MCECNCGSSHELSHKDNFNCVSVVPIFMHLNEDEMETIHSIAVSIEKKKGELVYIAGDKLDNLHVIFKGRVKQYRINQNGKEQVLRILEPGDFMGEMSLFSASEIKENAVAQEDTILCTIKGKDFRKLLSKFPSISLKVLDVLSKRLSQAEESIERINNTSVNQRVAAYLLDLAYDDKEITLPMNRADIASSLGTSQETLSRRLSSLEKDGIISQSGHRTIVINNIDRLKEIKDRDE